MVMKHNGIKYIFKLRLLNLNPLKCNQNQLFVMSVVPWLFANNPYTKNCHWLMDPKLRGLKYKLVCQNCFITVHSFYYKQHI